MELQQNTNAWNVNDNKIKEVYHHKPIPINSSFTEFLYKQVHKLIAKYQDVQDLGLSLIFDLILMDIGLHELHFKVGPPILLDFKVRTSVNFVILQTKRAEISRDLYYTNKSLRGPQRFVCK